MSSARSAVAGRRLLLLNWRDLGHPRAGGAEVYCEEIGQRLADAGADVTLFTARHPGAAARERRHGMTVLRGGGELGVYAQAARHLQREVHRYDAVIDFQNGIPFFAPLFARAGTAVVCVVHHVHQEQFAVHYRWPISRVGQILEGPVSRRVYGRRPVVAVSPSTRRDIRRRLRLQGPIHVIPNGLVQPRQPVTRHRAAAPTIVVVSRLVSHKRFDLLLDALPELAQRWPDVQVHIAGDGPERGALERRAAELRLRSRVRFHGYVSNKTRQHLLESAWLTVSPSQAEGWGLTVLEANAAGVPAVAFPVPGLRDSIVDGETGWLVPPGSSLAGGIDTALRALAPPGAEAAWSERCVAWASLFSWDASAERLASVVAAEIDRMRTSASSQRLASDLAVRVDVELDPGVDVQARLPAALRRSDQWALRDAHLHLLLHSCDELGAQQVLRRLGVDRVQRMDLATSMDLLVGAR